MKICSFSKKGSNESRLGLWEEDNKTVFDLGLIEPRIFASFFSLLDECDRENLSIQQIIGSRMAANRNEARLLSHDSIDLKIPLRSPEIWGAGITYGKSREAREIETSLKGLYRQVYDARRPEIFFKTTGLRCVGPDTEVSIRSDSKWTVPEPELGVVFGKDLSIIGYTIGNDMSARDIEGENALYLPQAKIFQNCCAIGPVVVTNDEIQDPSSLDISMRITRDSTRLFEGSTSTSMMKRSIQELASFLKRDNPIPAGSVLMTGTGIVPPDDFTLRDGDMIEIEIEKIGILRNRAKQL